MKDLSHLNTVAASDKGMTYELVGPDGAKTGVKLRFYGFDTDTVVQAGRTFDKSIADLTKEESGKMHPDDVAQMRRARLVAAAVFDWDDMALDGKPVTPANAEEFLRQRGYEWIVNPIHRLAANRLNFFKGDLSS